MVDFSSCQPDRCEPATQPDFYQSWLVDSHPPNSYTVEIAYVNTTGSRKSRRSGKDQQPKKLSTDASYTESELSWMTMPLNFTNYAQARVYAGKNYPQVLYRIGTSSSQPNYFKYDTY